MYTIYHIQYKKHHVSFRGYTLEWVLDLGIGWGKKPGVEIGDIEGEKKKINKAKGVYVWINEHGSVT